MRLEGAFQAIAACLGDNCRHCLDALDMKVGLRNQILSQELGTVLSIPISSFNQTMRHPIIVTHILFL